MFSNGDLGWRKRYIERKNLEQRDLIRKRNC